MDYRAFSRQVLDVSLSVRRGERVWINGWDHTVQLVSHLARECKRRGCKTITTVQSEDSWLNSLKSGPISNLEKLSQNQKALLDEIDSYIFTLGPRHPIDWKEVPPRRRGLATIWLLESNRLVRKWKTIASRRKVKLLGIEATLATRERAEALGMDFDTYAKSMYDGCLADSRQMLRRGKRLSSVLGKRASVRITTPSGTDLQFSLDDRPVEMSHGLVTDEETRKGRPVFLPAGAVGTTVDEKSAIGVIVYDHPIRRWNGMIKGLKVRVNEGRITRWEAPRGSVAFKEYLDNNGRDADRFAFVGFGLNPMLKPGCTQDDKVLGCIELNFGESESRGGKNKGIRNFWGAVSTANVVVDDHHVMKSGKLFI